MRLTRASNSAIHEEHTRLVVHAWSFEILPWRINTQIHATLLPTPKIYKAIYDIFAFISDSNMKWCPSIAFCYYICEVRISIQLEFVNHFINHVFCWSLSHLCSRNFRWGIWTRVW